MQYIEIDNIDIAELEIYAQLRESAFRADNSFIADSPKVVNILLQSSLEIKSILATRQYYDEYEALIQKSGVTKLFLTTKEQMSKIVGHKIHHNCMMHGIRPQDYSLDELGDNIIMLDNITSSENVGSIARSAAGLNVDSYLLPTQSPHPYSRRALRVSMGYANHLKVGIYSDILTTIATLKSRGYKVFAAELTKNSTPLMEVEVPKKWVLLMGHEGRGISKEILDLCDEVVSIEMQKSVKSFNVGVAASIIMYRFKA